MLTLLAIESAFFQQSNQPTLAIWHANVQKTREKKYEDSEDGPGDLRWLGLTLGLSRSTLFWNFKGLPLYSDIPVAHIAFSFFLFKKDSFGRLDFISIEKDLSFVLGEPGKNGYPVFTIGDTSYSMNLLVLKILNLQFYFFPEKSKTGLVVELPLLASASWSTVHSSNDGTPTKITTSRTGGLFIGYSGIGIAFKLNRWNYRNWGFLSKWGFLPVNTIVNLMLYFNYIEPIVDYFSKKEITSHYTLYAGMTFGFGRGSLW